MLLCVTGEGVRRRAMLLSSHEDMILFNTTGFFSQWITLTPSVTDLFITSQCKDILLLVYQLSEQDVLRNSGAFFLRESYMDGSAARNQRRQLFY